MSKLVTKKRAVVFPLLLALASSSLTVCAAELTGTLAKIKENNMVTMGFRESSVPFSYYDDARNIVGYSQEFSNLIVAKIKSELNLPNLKVNALPLTAQNRIPLLQNGTYDFECGTTTNNTARQKQVAFSNTFFIIGTRFMVDKSAGIKDLADLKGKRIAVTAGSTTEAALNQINEAQKLDLTIVSFKDNAIAVRTLESGRVDAFLNDDAGVAGQRARLKEPEKWDIVGTPVSIEAYGCMIRKDDPEFKALVDSVIAEAHTSGASLTFFNKWFKSPIPPTGVNINFDASTELLSVFKNPNDKAFE